MTEGIQGDKFSAAGQGDTEEGGPSFEDSEDSARDLLQSAQLQEDRRKFDRGTPERRTAERLEIDADAKLCHSMRSGFNGRLVDLSTNGCSIAMSSGAFKVGDVVWMKVDSLQHWKGTVRWVNPDRLGVEFENPFYPAVLEHLVQSNRKVSCTKAA